jgi:hypothetical protein
MECPKGGRGGKDRGIQRRGTKRRLVPTTPRPKRVRALATRCAILVTARPHEMLDPQNTVSAHSNQVCTASTDKRGKITVECADTRPDGGHRAGPSGPGPTGLRAAWGVFTLALSVSPCLCPSASRPLRSVCLSASQPLRPVCLSASLPLCLSASLPLCLSASLIPLAQPWWSTTPRCSAFSHGRSTRQ